MVNVEAWVETINGIQGNSTRCITLTSSSRHSSSGGTLNYSQSVNQKAEDISEISFSFALIRGWCEKGLSI